MSSRAFGLGLFENTCAASAKPARSLRPTGGREEGGGRNARHANTNTLNRRNASELQQSFPTHQLSFDLHPLSVTTMGNCTSSSEQTARPDPPSRGESKTRTQDPSPSSEATPAPPLGVYMCVRRCCISPPLPLCALAPPPPLRQGATSNA